MKIKSAFTAVAASLATFAAAAPSLAVSWVYIGQASTGEAINVDSDSIYEREEGIGFTYSLNDEVITAVAYCSSNQWYAEGYGVYSPQSQATQDMLSYVCQ
ncbi:hypothetical protein IQ235_18720 [Oscillatoriales cyanobacterium LEGE 11467]|uniref:Uncharacterized protein n=1 Tax=Zarconia navalis LEGE 11467 TaxID=1828826 RepID=A0A928W2H5_9CYAN|nr:hypothetical protein [Zarconia navalis]MBE9042796.1 hypothetical protein [Zarconia navalis LEGE 11467]